LQTISLARKFNIPVVFRSIDILHILVPHTLLRPITRFLEKRVYSRADLVLPNTPQYHQYVIDMGVPESRTKFVPFPVDTNLFSPAADSTEVRQKWGLNEQDPVIVFIGTLFPFSGLDGFIRQFPQVLRELPEVKLLIVGDGPQRQELERIIAESDLEKQVIITGFQPYVTMPQYINLATICINPFLISEKTMDIFPAKMVQYVACGKATVATALRGITTYLQGEEHGVVYVNNMEDMAREAVALLKSAKRRQELGNAGLEHIRQTYSYEKIARELEKILEKAIKEKHGAKSGQA
jgi:glycosyltransferase involved in cell wall biosynthesis